MTTPTPPPPLDVIAYYVDEFTLRTFTEFDNERAGSGDFSIDFDYQQDENDPRHFRIAMSIRFAEHGYVAEENPQYSVTLKLKGYFSFVEGTPDEVMHRMIDVNGSSILYGLARGYVGQATSAAANGQFLLPAVNFLALVNAREEQRKAAAIEKGAAEKATPQLPAATEEAIEHK